MNADLTAWLDEHLAALVALRRDLHAHPELAWGEERTTAVVAAALERAGLAPKELAGGTGLVCDVGSGDGPALLLRADLDALPLQEATGLPWASTVPGLAHACGHDVHTAVVLGAGLALAALGCPRPVRLLFQPAEEVMPGGALSVVEQGVLEGVGSAFALHCDPSLDVGHVGVRPGPITAATDDLTVTLTGPGGHTSRPHLTVDLVQAMATVLTGLPSALSRRVDPRAGLAMVWGAVHAGSASNAIPSEAVARGTVRVLDSTVWDALPPLVEELVRALAAPYGATVDVVHIQGVPPVDNDLVCSERLVAAAERALGAGAATPTPQSLGGEDFGWITRAVPGAMGRLGVRAPGSVGVRDLHRGTFDVDEDCLAAGIRVLVEVALGD